MFIVSFFLASPSNDCYCDFILMARELAIYLQDSSETFLLKSIIDNCWDPVIYPYMALL